MKRIIVRFKTTGLFSKIKSWFTAIKLAHYLKGLYKNSGEEIFKESLVQACRDAGFDVVVDEKGNMTATKRHES